MSGEQNPKTVPEDLRPYVAMAEFLVSTFGPECEAIVHDLRTPRHSVVHIAGGTVTGRSVGEAFRHIVSEALSGGDANGVLPPYFFRQAGKLIRMGTLLVRGPTGIIGALCVNHDVTRLFQDQQRLAAFLPPAACPQAQAAPAESRTVGEIVFSIIDSLIDAELPLGQSPTRAQRLEIVGFLEARDVFQMKGALERVAERLGVSRVTVYSDLDEVRGKGRRRAAKP